MKAKSDIWKPVMIFLAGCLVCYALTQYRFFDLDNSLSVVETLLSLITLLSALYIADNIQRKITSRQNRTSFLTIRLERLWSDFMEFSNLIDTNPNLARESLIWYQKKILKEAVFLSKAARSFNLHSSGFFDDLERKLDSIEEVISNCPVTNNVVNISSQLGAIQLMISEAEELFMKVLPMVQKV